MTTHHSGHFPSTDGTRLAYQSWLPPAPRAIVGVIHGWSDHAGRYGNLADHLTQAGIGVYGLDLRGHGVAEGQRGHIRRWTDFHRDLHSFLHLIQQCHPPGTPLFLMGHSAGGLVVMDYAIHFPNEPLHGVIASAPLLASPNISPITLAALRLLSRVAPRLGLNPGADAATLSRDPAVCQAYTQDPLVHQRVTPRYATQMETAQRFVLANVDGIHYPFLLVYGAADKLVPPDVTRATFAQVGASDKTRQEYVGGFHELINDTIKAEVLADITTWLEARLT